MSGYVRGQLEQLLKAADFVGNARASLHDLWRQGALYKGARALARGARYWGGLALPFALLFSLFG